MIAANRPIRVERERTRGWRMPANTVYVGRGSMWGNPFLGVTAVANFHLWVSGEMSEPDFLRLRGPYAETFFGRRIEFDQARRIREGIRALRGKNLACWCCADMPCHADVLLTYAAELEPFKAQSDKGEAA